jgi:hypothetical protein
VKQLLLVLVLSIPVVAAGPLAAGERPLFGPSRLGALHAAPEAALMAQIGGTRPKENEREKEEEQVRSERPEGYVNPRKAMLYSLLLPGLGQQVSGRDERARVFFGVEAAIWTSFVAFRLQGDARKDRYIEFAEFAGGIDPSGKGDDYWRTVASFERSDPGPGSANELIKRQARVLYPGDKAAQDRYFDENGYFGDEAWDWQNADNLARFQDLRGKSLDSYDRAEYSIALALVHRLVSVIDAARVAGQVNKSLAQQQKSPEGFGMRFGMKLVKDGEERVPMLTVKTSF